MATKKKVQTKPTSLSEKSVDELKSMLVVAQNDLIEAKRSHASRELANTARLKELRAGIARINTALAQSAREQGENNG